MITQIGAQLPEELYKEFLFRAKKFPKGKSGLIREALKNYFEQNPLTDEEKTQLSTMVITTEGKGRMWNIPETTEQNNDNQS